MLETVCVYSTVVKRWESSKEARQREADEVAGCVKALGIGLTLGSWNKPCLKDREGYLVLPVV